VWGERECGTSPEDALGGLAIDYSMQTPMQSHKAPRPLGLPPPELISPDKHSQATDFIEIFLHIPSSQK